jgi:hypothetical protein
MATGFWKSDRAGVLCQLRLVPSDMFVSRWFSYIYFLSGCANGIYYWYYHVVERTESRDGDTGPRGWSQWSSASASMRLPRTSFVFRTCIRWFCELWNDRGTYNFTELSPSVRAHKGLSGCRTQASVGILQNDRLGFEDWSRYRSDIGDFTARIPIFGNPVSSFFPLSVIFIRYISRTDRMTLPAIIIGLTLSYQAQHHCLSICKPLYRVAWC